MPDRVFPHTPEALLGRNDSKNPATTCRGITSSGRPCRRALAAPKTPAGGGQEGAEAQDANYYCWQHKDQVKPGVLRNENHGSRPARENPSTELFPLQERDSLDTMIQRLEINAHTEVSQARRFRRAEHANDRPSRLPANTQTQDFATPRTGGGRAPYAEKEGFAPPARRTASAPKQTPRGFWESLCCMAGDDEDYVEIVRHRKRVESADRRQRSKLPRNPYHDEIQQPVRTSSKPSARLDSTSTLPVRPVPQQRKASNPHTGRLLSLIPQHLPPQTTSQLLAELIKPISPNDEAGFIYIFWLTPQSLAAPAEATARALLAPPATRPPHHRRISDVMTEYSFDGSEADTQRRRGRRTIMLKIGRANNVTRRMHEWQRQCGYELTLVRWYPYVPSSSSSSSPQPSPQASPMSEGQSMAGRRESEPGRPGTGQRKTGEGVKRVAYAKRVERLIHLELAEKQLTRQCRACGREHREWFEVEASQAGVKAVDECVRRWVAWADELAG